MEYLIFAVVMLGFIVLFMVKGFLDYRKSQREFIRKLRSDYGVLPQKEYKPEQFANISHYFLKHREGFVIDDITWNDLNMDDVFKRMNYTWSAAGEEYLYYILRKPALLEDELLHQEEIIEFFQNNPDERVAIQYIYSRLGKTGKFSIYDYLDYLDDLGERSNFPHYLMIVLLIGAAASLFVNLPVGILFLACVLIYNNISYFKIKNEIDPYIVSFAYVFRILDTVKKLLPHRIPVLEEELSCLKSYSGAMSSFRRGSFLLMSGGRMSGSGNPLEMLLDFVRMGFHLDLIKFNQMLSEMRRHIREIDGMITVLGKIEAMIAIGAWRESLESYCTPVFGTQTAIRTRGLYHPLIENPVKNDLTTDGSVLITGSNASGKSTFLKTVALGSILAQTVHTVLADSYEGAMCRPVSSMSLRDDVQGGDSYYMVEIKALKRILDLLETEGLPVLCFVDEVLRGTNTIERIAASTQILKSIAKQNNMCFAATHDIELTYLLESFYHNYHFEEEIAGNDISFSYKIMEGRASTRNAIRLLGIMGYAPDIIEEAEAMAGDIALQGYYSEARR
ncbi:hypothetical protein AALB47_11195 [Lachnospiraceae bacterium 54-11]